MGLDIRAFKNVRQVIDPRVSEAEDLDQLMAAFEYGSDNGYVKYT